MSDQTTVDFRPNPDGTPNSWLCNSCQREGSFMEMTQHVRIFHRKNPPIVRSVSREERYEKTDSADLETEIEAQGILIAQLQQENAELTRKLKSALRSPDEFPPPDAISLFPGSQRNK